jgi:hypothetical protein
MILRLRSLLLLAACALPCIEAYATYYETLPKGVRLLAYRRVQTTSVSSQFGESGQKESIGFEKGLGSDDLLSIPTVQIYLDEMKNISPDAYDKFLVGAYKIDADAQILVHGFGLAYGLSDRLTAYLSVPYYDARVTMNVQRTAPNNYQEVADLLSASGDKSDTARLMEQLTRQLPDADGPFLQSVLMNQYGYSPIGNWEGKGLGDIEIAALYRLTDWQSSGLATSFGLAAPTGRISNPDILQDISFGDGQWDVFGEFGGGIHLLDKRLGLNSSLRYTYQLPSTKTFRLPDQTQFSLSSEKFDVKEKMGDEIYYNFKATWTFNSWIEGQAGMDYRYRFPSEYSSSSSQANELLARFTDEKETRIRAGFLVSTIEAFKNKKFAMPMSLGLTGMKTVSGSNIPDLTRLDLELRIFF